jgi:cell division protein FtsI/penicillin-binding protein 2
MTSTNRFATSAASVRRTTPATRRALPAAMAGILLASSLAACSQQAPDPSPAAQALAQGLQAANLDAVPLTDGSGTEATEALLAAYGSLADMQRTVEVQAVALDETADDGPATATATLRTAWDLDESDNDWSYTTSATLEYNAEAESWQTRFTPEVAVEGLLDGESLRLRTTAAQRGDILGSGDDVLVTNREVLRMGLDKTLLDGEPAAASASALARLVDIDEADFAARVDAAGDKAFVEAIVLRDDESLEISDADLAVIPGARAIPDELPLAPTRTFARAVLGTVGEDTAELVEKSDGRLSAGDATGLSGLQATYDERLAGRKGLSVWTVPADAGEGAEGSASGAASDGAGEGQAEEPRELFSLAPVDGDAIHTTLDAPLQRVAEGIVSETDSPSGIVALRPSDGSVLAAASGPDSNSYNTAMIGRYAPGSTFKVVSALAMLRSGYTPQSKVQCPQTTVLDGRTFKNYTGYPAAGLGTITLSEAIAQSCNTVFIRASEKVDMSTVSEAAGSLGLAPEPAAGAPAFLGSVPSDSTGTEHAANMIGQGVVESSVLGMATVAASVAKGSTVSPHIVADPEPGAGAKPSTPLTEAEAKQLLAMMGGTVDHGTVTELQDVPGPAVAAKTGTAEYGDGKEDLRHTWVIAIQGDLAVAAFVETGFSGAETGGPLIKEFLTRANALTAAGD